jgi:hypothetical protein
MIDHWAYDPAGGVLSDDESTVASFDCGFDDDIGFLLMELWRDRGNNPYEVRCDEPYSDLTHDLCMLRSMYVTDVDDILKQMLEWRSRRFPFVSKWVQTFLFCFCLWLQAYMMEDDTSDCSEWREWIGLHFMDDLREFGELYGEQWTDF